MLSTTDLVSAHGNARLLSSRLLWAYRGSPQADDDWSVEFEASSSAFFVERGEVRLRIAKTEHRIKAGDLFLAAAGVRRQLIPRGTRLLSVGYELFWANGRPVYAEGLNRLLPGAMAGGPGRELHQAGVTLVGKLHAGRGRVDFIDSFHAGRLAGESYLDRQVAFWSWFVTYHALLKSEGIVPDVPQARTSWAKQVQDHLDARPLDAPFAQVKNELSLPVGWRRVQQLFQDELQVSPQRYFEGRRLDAARRLLIEPTLTVKEVAAQLGFRSLSHFSDWFKRSSGVSPRQFRPRD